MDKAKFWERQYNKHIQKIIGVCYRYVNDRLTAEDLAHDAFLKAIEKADTYQAFGRFESWLTRIAVNQSIDYLRKRTDSVPINEEAVSDAMCENEDDSWLAGAEFTQSELVEIIGKLPERQRTVFELYAIDSRPHTEIAQMLGITPNNSKALLFRARQSLKKLLHAKVHEKEKRKKGILMILMIFTLTSARPAGIDKLFRKGLGSLRMPPSAPLPASTIRQAAATSPSGAGVTLAAHKTAIALAAAAGLAGGACAWQIARTQPSQTSPALPDTAAATCPDTAQTCTKETESATANGVRRSTKNKPITVTQEVEVRETVIVRDTDIVKDTIYLFGKP